MRNTRGRWSMQPVPGGYKIRPYSVDGGACGRRSARTRGVAGRCGHRPPTRRNHRTPAGIGTWFRAGIKPAPYGKTGGGSVGADFISAHTHRRVGCTHPVGADVGIGPYEAEPSNPGGNRNLVPGGHKARPYGKTGGGSVGADFISAHTHRRVGCTHPVGADVGIGPLRGGTIEPRRESEPGSGRA